MMMAAAADGTDEEEGSLPCELVPHNSNNVTPPRQQAPKRAEIHTSAAWSSRRHDNVENEQTRLPKQQQTALASSARYVTVHFTMPSGAEFEDSFPADKTTVKDLVDLLSNVEKRNQRNDKIQSGMVIRNETENRQAHLKLLLASNQQSNYAAENCKHSYLERIKTLCANKCHEKAIVWYDDEQVSWSWLQDDTESLEAMILRRNIKTSEPEAELAAETSRRVSIKVVDDDDMRLRAISTQQKQRLKEGISKRKKGTAAVVFSWRNTVLASVFGSGGANSGSFIGHVTHFAWVFFPLMLYWIIRLSQRELFGDSMRKAAENQLPPISYSVVGILGGFQSLFLVFFASQAYTRFLQQYSCSMAMEGRIFDVILLARAILSPRAAHRLWRQYVPFCAQLSVHIHTYITMPDNDPCAAQLTCYRAQCLNK
jgi:hypothetical protein